MTREEAGTMSNGEVILNTALSGIGALMVNIPVIYVANMILRRAGD